ncbi:MAG: dTMP kinase [Myxococcales bacterium]|nr:dTMP kinase [Myxococcales bacterium]
MSRGRFIVLEGLDGAGTTTQCAAIARVFQREGVRVHVTMEPSPGPVGSLIRQALTTRVGLPGGASPLTPETMALLFAADRVDHLAAEVEPALAEGALVLSDRYLLSSLAYQGAQVGRDWVRQLNARARQPDLTLFLRVDAEVAACRRESRGGRPELYEAAAVQRRTAASYQKAIALRRRAGEKVLIIDGNAPPDQVTAACVEAIRGLEGRRR